jgi:hypothetical protein
VRKGLPIRYRLNSAIQGEVLVEGTHSHDRNEKCIKILIEKNWEERKDLEDLCVDGLIILRRIVKKLNTFCKPFQVL